MTTSDLAEASDARGRTGDPLWSLRGVRQERGGRVTLDGIDLDLPRGEVVALVGPSGAGKTSLLRLLDRLDEPAGGEVRFRDRPLASYAVRELRRRVGFVFQAPVMFAGTVADNLAVARELCAGDGRVRRADAEALRLAGLDDEYLARDAERLSGGERQRVSIARALVAGPEALLLDEPTSALDPEVADRLMATVRALGDAGLTVVMVTHRLDEARVASTHAVMMEAGRVVESGPTAELWRAPKAERTRAFLLGRD